LQNFVPSRFRLIRRSLVTSEIMHAHARNRLADELRRRMRACTDRANLTTLQRLLHRLDNATDQRLPSVVAEVLVARRALLAGCTVDAETPTPTGRTCDFRLARDGVLLHVHVKRLDAPPMPQITVPATLRRAIRCTRALRVGMRWSDELDATGLRRLGHAFDAFLREGEIGESLSVRDGSQHELGHLRIDRPAEHLDVRVDRPDRLAVLDRLDRLLDRASQQCMPGRENAIMVVGACEADAELLDQALLGEFIARWDRLPRRGERQAFGRDDTGLWSRGAARDAGIACWCTMDGLDSAPKLSAGHMWLRDEPAPKPESAALARASLLRSRAG
jgi:hypothetical protein